MALLNTDRMVQYNKHGKFLRGKYLAIHWIWNYMLSIRRQIKNCMCDRFCVLITIFIS